MKTNQIEEIQRLANAAQGALTEDAVIEAARDPDNPLHPCFDWDDASAAAKYRRVQARSMIRRVQIVVETTDYRIRIPAYVRDPDVEPNQQGYTSVVQVKTEHDRRREILVAEFARAAAALDRAYRIAKYFGLQEDAQVIHQQLLALQAKAQQADTAELM